MKKRIVIIILLLFILLIAGFGLFKYKTKNILSLDEVKAQTLDFINNSLMRPGSTVSIKEASEENGLYKIVLNMPDGSELPVYVTKDGKKVFPQVIDVEEAKQKAQEQKEQKEAAQKKELSSIPKKDKVDIELFVMSHCPFGTQIEKGLLPVLDLLGDKVNFQLKFCDYAMHGEKEVKEELTQYCIEKEEPRKLKSYLYCFLDSSNSDECLKKAHINIDKIETCKKETDKKFKITEKLNDKSTWRNGRFPVVDLFKEDNQKYGVKGSPTLIINGQKVSSGRSPQELLNTICAGFSGDVKECHETLSDATPSPGFGFSGSSNNSDGGCGG